MTLQEAIDSGQAKLLNVPRKPKTKWDWEIMTDKCGGDMCSRLAERESEGWTVAAICETDAGSGYYKVFMRRDTHPSGVML